MKADLGTNTNNDGAPGIATAVVQSLAAVVAAVVAGTLAPNWSAAQWHAGFNDFFVAVSTVNGALLIAIAIEARYGKRLKPVAIVTAICLTCGLVGSVLALSPLPRSFYGWLLAIMVGGGIGGLIAAFVVGWSNLKRDIDEDRAKATSKELAQELGRRAMQLKISMPDGKEGTLQLIPKEEA